MEAKDDFNDQNTTDNGLVHFPQPTLTSSETLELGSTILIASSQPLSDSDQIFHKQSIFSYFQQELLILCLDYLSPTEISHCNIVSKYWENVTKNPRVWVVGTKLAEKKRKIESRRKKMEAAQILYNQYQEEVRWRPWCLCSQMSFQTPYHDQIFQLLILFSLILSPLKLDNLIHLSWTTILLPSIVGLFLMIVRIIVLLINNWKKFDRYSNLEKGTLFMSLGIRRGTQIRWGMAVLLANLSLILFLIYLERGPDIFPLYVPVIPSIFVSLLIIESTWRSEEVDTSSELAWYISFGGLCAFVHLILLTFKWSSPSRDVMIKGYFLFLPLYLYYAVSFFYIIVSHIANGLDYAFRVGSNQFEKILWVQGVFSLFTFHFLLNLKIDLFYTEIKFIYCVIPILIWCFTNFLVIYSLFSDSFFWWLKWTNLPDLVISPSKRRELELQRYMPVPPL